MSQPTRPQKLTHEQSNSLSSSQRDQKQYFNRSSITKNHKHLINVASSSVVHPDPTTNPSSLSSATASSKSSASNNNNKMGSLKKWFSRFGKDSKGGDDDYEKKAHRDIESRIAAQAKTEATTVNILLLGAGGSGKSTVLKQMDRIHNREKYEHSQQTLMHTIREVHKNIVLDMYDLCKQYYMLKQSAAANECKFESSDMENIALKIATTHDPIHDHTLTAELANEIELLWSTKTMKYVYNIRKKSHIMDNTPYFFDNVRKYADPHYVAGFDDYVRIREATTGVINNHRFVFLNNNRKWLLCMTDVGGQRSERRKWLQVFSGVDVVIYVMSLSAYDQVLYEDHTTRCWDETLALFEKTTSSKAFKTTDFIVFLNKSDLFHEKIKSVPFTVYKKDWSEEHKHNGEEVINWIREQFALRFYRNDLQTQSRGGFTINYKDEHADKEEEEEKHPDLNALMLQNTKSNKRGLHFHVTCSIRTDQIEHVVRIVQIELIRKLMSRAALM
mmetsp:Transcript_63838/g.101604  ORF Transcript_63838/g.101604 Transcript_63838/m.101604 type:complete len:502 (+) Transcript_63838:54-1559(+)|eukprot:CAMPEP_0197031840 /NCGR_PEP_ID=MMETSP1384-20130603/10697_1 /TAXON_ID=29189 /ORGANISM="Ammonia sp." /LENGTH=501 /DNA_ID=CAMNT_0042461417 /DNA_START=45 /DNA_END=1550 /DNA_ORIENTATION=+